MFWTSGAVPAKESLGANDNAANLNSMLAGGGHVLALAP
jgi:hypothetical protein